jgi:hypothetical protein
LVCADDGVVGAEGNAGDAVGIGRFCLDGERFGEVDVGVVTRSSDGDVWRFVGEVVEVFLWDGFFASLWWLPKEADGLAVGLFEVFEFDIVESFGEGDGRCVLFDGVLCPVVDDDVTVDVESYAVIALCVERVGYC